MACLTADAGNKYGTAREPARPAHPLVRAFVGFVYGLLGVLPALCTAQAGPASVERAAFYAPYAAMATEVYRSGTATESWFGPALSTAWLRREIDVHGTALNQKRFWTLELGLDQEREDYLKQLKINCIKELDRDAVPVSAALSGAPVASPKQLLGALQGQADEPRRANCHALKWELELQADQLGSDQAEVNIYHRGEPEVAKDCDWSLRAVDGRGARPKLDVQAVVDRAGWNLIPELRRVSAVRGWRIFVPELAIDVWQRQRAGLAGQRVYEYAIVFRGTVGGGGWVSNLRGLTAGLPIFWDQYAQALDVTRKLVTQIQGMHVLRDNLLEISSSQPTELFFTAVGHSLGGGLAQHVFLNVPAITRVVGFDPSPLNGASLIPVDTVSRDAGLPADAEGWPAEAARAAQVKSVKQTRTTVMANGKRLVDTATERRALQNTIPGAAIYLLHEHGELLAALRPCRSGPLWGSEGGPVMACESVNYSQGGPLAQHSMAELACRLDLASRGIQARGDS